MALKGREYLRNHLALKRNRVLLRYKYYDMKNGIKYFRTLIPAEFMWMAETLGWCGKAVDSLADRLSFREFKNDNFDLNSIFAMNSADIFTELRILSTMVENIRIVTVCAMFSAAVTVPICALVSPFSERNVCRSAPDANRFAAYTQPLRM